MADTDQPTGRTERQPLTDEVLALIDEAVAGLPRELDDSRRVISERYASNATVREQAEQILANARAEARELASMSSVARLADEQAETMRDQAAKDAIALRVEADRYIDTRLAEFEAELQKTQGQLKTMRARLAARSHLDRSDATALPNL